MLDPGRVDPLAVLVLELALLALAWISQSRGILDPDSKRRRLRIALAGSVPFLLLVCVIQAGLILLLGYSPAPASPDAPSLAREVATSALLVLPLVPLASLVHFRTRSGMPVPAVVHVAFWSAISAAVLPRPPFAAAGTATRLVHPLWLAGFLVPLAASFFFCHARLRTLLGQKSGTSRADHLGPGLLVLIAGGACLWSIASARRLTFFDEIETARATVGALRSRAGRVESVPLGGSLPMDDALARLRKATGLDLGRDPTLWEEAVREAARAGRLNVAGGQSAFLARTIASRDSALARHALVFFRSPLSSGNSGEATRAWNHAGSPLEAAVRGVFESSPDEGLRYHAAATLLRAFDVRTDPVLRTVLEAGIPGRDTLLAPGRARTVEAGRACVIDDLVSASLALNRGTASELRGLLAASAAAGSHDLAFAIHLLSDEVSRRARARSADPPTGPILALASLGPQGRGALHRDFIDYGPPSGDGREDRFFLALMDAVAASLAEDRVAASEALSKSLLVAARAWAARSPERAPRGEPASADDPNLARLVDAVATPGGGNAFPAVAAAFAAYAPQAGGDKNWLKMADALRALDPRAARAILEKALLDHPPLSADDATYRSLLGFSLAPPWEAAQPLGRKLLARYKLLGDPDENYRQIVSTLVGLGGSESVPLLIDELLEARERAPGLPGSPDTALDPNREMVKKALVALGPKVSGPAVVRALAAGGGGSRGSSPSEADLVDVVRTLGMGSSVDPILKRMRSLGAVEILGKLGRLYSAFATAVGELGGPEEREEIEKERERLRGFSPPAREAERDLEMAAAKLIARHIIGPETTLATLKAFRPGRQGESGGRYADMLARTIRDAGSKSAYPVLLEELRKFDDVKNEDYGALVEAIGKVGGKEAGEVLLAELASFRAHPSLADKDENVPGYRNLVRALALLPAGESQAAAVNEALLAEMDRNEIPHPELYDCVRSALQEAERTELLVRRSHATLATLTKGTVKESPADRFTLLKNAAMEGEWDALGPLLTVLMTSAPSGPDDAAYIRMVDELKELRLAGPHGDGPGPEGTRLIASTLQGERDKFKDPPRRGEAFLHLLTTMMVFVGEQTMGTVLETSLASPGQRSDVQEGLQALIESLPGSSEEPAGGGEPREPAP